MNKNDIQVAYLVIGTPVVLVAIIVLDWFKVI
jgi:hypothetical protein